jgi:hypothetical protein
MNLKPFYICILGPNLSSTPFADNDSCYRGPCRVKLFKPKSFGPTLIANMKFFVVLVSTVSLIAAVQAQFSFGAPAPGSTIQAGKDVTVQIIVPIDTVSDILCLPVGFAYLLPTHLECGSRPSGSQPCNRHC